MVNTYKHLKVWQKADRLGNQILDVTRYFPRDKDTFLTEQIRRQSEQIVHAIERAAIESECSTYISFLKDTYGVVLQLRKNLERSHSRGYIGKNAYGNIEKAIDDIIVAIARHIRMLEYLDSSLDASHAYSYTLLFW